MTEAVSSIDMRPLPHTPECPPVKAKVPSQGGGPPKKATRSRNRLPGAAKQLPEDGFHWLKYGHKNILGNSFSRAYYRCAQKGEGCPARKTVDFPMKNQGDLCITYDGDHNHSASNSPLDPSHVLVRHKGHEDNAALAGTPLVRHTGYCGQLIDTNSSSSVHLSGSLPKWKVPPPPLAGSNHSAFLTHHSQDPLEVPPLESSPEGSPAAHALFTRTLKDEHGQLPGLHQLPPYPYGLGQMPWVVHSSAAIHGTPQCGVPDGGRFPPWGHMYSGGGGVVLSRGAGSAEAQTPEDSFSGSGSTHAPSPGAVIRPTASRPAGLLQEFLPEVSSARVSECAQCNNSLCTSPLDAAQVTGEIPGPLSLRMPIGYSSGAKREASDGTASADQQKPKRVLVSLAAHGERSDRHVDEALLCRSDPLRFLGAENLVGDYKGSPNCALDLTLRL